MRKFSLNRGIKYITLRFLHQCLMIVLTALVLYSCDHKELCFDHLNSGRVNVLFDWRYAPDANPKTMMLRLIHSESGAAQDFEFVGRDGGSLTTAAGSYTFVGVNGSTNAIRYATLTTDSDAPADNAFALTTLSTSLVTSLSTISERTSLRAPRAKGTEDQRIALPPDQIWVDCARNFNVITDNLNQSITLFPQQVYCTYTVKVSNVDNVQYVAETSATISGLAGAYIPALCELSDELVTVPFSMSADTNQSTLDGQVLTFGHCPNDADAAHILSIYVVMSTGETYVSNIDVTDQIENAPDQQNILITVDGLPLPEPSTTGGFVTSVDEWRSVTFNIKL